MKVERLKGLETPFYLYDTELLEQTLESIRRAVKNYPNYRVHYAIKANANPILLNVIRQYGLGIDCVSGGELDVCLKAGFKADSVVFAGVGKTDREIDLALEKEIGCFNVESIEELEVINERAALSGKVANVCLRINPDVDAHTHENITTGLAENKFGLSKTDILKWIEIAIKMEHVSFLGLHFHIGSQLLDMEPYVMLCQEINVLLQQLSASNIPIRIINVGGGLGIDYERPNDHPIPDFESYFNVFSKNLNLLPGQELHFELGRSIVGQCGTLVTRTLYVKKGYEKQFVIVDAGMTELIRPALYDAFHKIENISKSGNVRLLDTPEYKGDAEAYDVVGPICESSDVFVKDYVMPKTERGDLLAIRSAGAYGETMASSYNCRKLPQSYSLDELS